MHAFSVLKVVCTPGRLHFWKHSFSANSWFFRVKFWSHVLQEPENWKIFFSQNFGSMSGKCDFCSVKIDKNAKNSISTEAFSKANRCCWQASIDPKKLQKKFQENWICKFLVSQQCNKKTLKMAIFWVVAHLQNFYRFDFNSFLWDGLQQSYGICRKPPSVHENVSIEIEFSRFCGFLHW